MLQITDSEPLGAVLPYRPGYSLPLHKAMTPSTVREVNCIVTSKFKCWCSNSQCKDIWKLGLWEDLVFRWGHEDGALMTGLESLQETPKSLLSLHQYKDGLLQTRKQNFTRPWPCCTLIWNSSTSRLVRNTFLLSKIFSPWHFVRPAQHKTDRSNQSIPCPNFSHRPCSTLGSFGYSVAIVWRGTWECPEFWLSFPGRLGGKGTARPQGVGVQS